ncbi:unnamed protein product [Eruca vesicaria subsp. sativa]|uniref:Uncharacterized protein n=1 Tax=Eruca vesicaria subsp. sativa TaxID=29727 RepID=A0ABC8KFT2_ERUVS|nr:unnamed protein product [Eruca vesicaria subsp. sativa]
MDEREELRRLIPRQLVATLLAIFTMYNEHELKLDPKTTGRCASESNKLANMFFMLVVIRISITPVVLGRMRRTREACDTHLVFGSIFLLASLAFSAKLTPSFS